MKKTHRGHPLWYAYALHRASGLGLALFLPAHFYILSLALTQPERLEYFLNFAENPLVKVAEFGLWPYCSYVWRFAPDGDGMAAVV
jgi:fumarate reductase subunit D